MTTGAAAMMRRMDHHAEDDEGPVEAHPRAVMHQTIQQAIHDQADEEVHGSLLLGWVTIAEYQMPDGRRVISSLSGDARGEAASPWATEGLLFHRLHSWGGDEES